MKKASLLAACIFWAAFPLRAASTDPVQDLEGRVAAHTLKNGMKVLILERHLAPLVSFEMVFRAGGVDEASGKTGLAHMFEHMMFKGTRTVGTLDYAREKPILDRINRLAHELIAEEFKPQPDPAKVAAARKRMAELEARERAFTVPAEFDQIYEREGGQGLNAFTAEDMTGFVVSLPSNKWELWPIMESDRMAHPVLREFYKERDVVMEERLMRYENSPRGRLWENLVATAFQAHPYHHPTIGWMSDLERMTMDDARRFFKAHYAPNNVAVAIVGDVRAREVIPVLEKYFAKVSSQPLPSDAVTEEPPQQGERRATIDFDSEPSLMMAFHKPNSPRRDNYVMDLIQDLLGRGRSCRFNRGIVDKGVALTAYASNGDPGERYPNLIVLGGSPRAPHGNADLEEAVWAELARLQSERVSPRELERILNQEEADDIRNLASNSGMASQLAYNEEVLGDWRYSFEYLRELRKVTPEDIQRVARQYFTRKNCTVVSLEREKAAGR